MIETIPHSLILLAIFILGTCVGSFLNVCIGRLPESESIVHPRSRCPHCRTLIRAWYNIPILSFLFLRGQCATCRAPISIVYPLVEGMTGLFFIAVYLAYGTSLSTAVYAAFISALIVVTFIDLRHRIIPDEISLGGLALGLLMSLFRDDLTLAESFAAALLGGGVLYALAAGYQAITSHEGMGGGDIKLMAMMGAVLGLKGLLISMLVSSSTGALVGLFIVAKMGRKHPIPFGPYLAIGGIVAVFWTEPLWELLFALS